MSANPSAATRDRAAMRRTVTKRRLAKHVDCPCGKRGWRTKYDADQVVVNAKIMRHLHGNNQRQEQRAYRCVLATSLWHVTSQGERAYGVTYDPTDDESAREYIESLILAEGHRNTDRAWAVLLDPARVGQTSAALAAIHQAGLKEGTDRKAEVTALAAAVKAGTVPPYRLNVAEAEHKAWKSAWLQFQGVLLARKTQTRHAV